VKVRDSANKSSNKGPVNGFKRVATLHPEPEKQDSTQENLTANNSDDQNEPGLDQPMTNSNSPATKLNKTGTKPGENAKCVSGYGQLNDHRPEFLLQGNMCTLGCDSQSTSSKTIGWDQ